MNSITGGVEWRDGSGGEVFDRTVNMLYKQYIVIGMQILLT